MYHNAMQVKKDCIQSRLWKSYLLWKGLATSVYVCKMLDLQHIIFYSLISSPRKLAIFFQTRPGEQTKIPLKSLKDESYGETLQPDGFANLSFSMFSKGE